MKISTVFQVLMVLYVIDGVTLGQDPAKTSIKDPWHVTPEGIQTMIKCPIVSPEDGKALPRSNGRVVKYICKSGFQLVGKQYSTCIKGRWNSPSPVCVARGCDPLSPPVNGHVTSIYGGAVYSFTCDHGYQLTGSPTLYCNRYHWNSTTPTCNPSWTTPSKVKQTLPIGTTSTPLRTTVKVETTAFVDMRPNLPPWSYMKKTTTPNPNEIDKALRPMVQRAGGGVGIPGAIGIAIGAAHVVLILAALLTAVAFNLNRRRTHRGQESLNGNSDVKSLIDSD